VSDRKNDHVSPAGRRRLRWAGLALVMLVLLTVLGIAAVLGGLPEKLAGRDGAHSTAASSPGQVNGRVPRGFVVMSVGGPLFHTVGSLAPGDYADISATVDSRKFSPVNGRSVTRTVFTSVSVYEVDTVSTGAPKMFRLVLSQCDAEYMSWFLSNATLVTVTPGRANASQPDPADLCFNRFGVSNQAVDARWHFSSAPADPVAVAARIQVDPTRHALEPDRGPDGS
jgi:hypothetical protein